MAKILKKACIMALAATLTFGSTTSTLAAVSSPVTSVTPEKATNVAAETKKSVETIVNTTKKGNATVVSINKTAKKKVTVSAKLNVGGVDYKVRTIAANAFENCTDVVTITLPSTVTSIKKSAFSGTSSTLKNIVFNNKKAIEVKSGAFKGVDTKELTIKVTADMSKKQYNKFVETLKAAGFEGTIKQLKK